MLKFNIPMLEHGIPIVGATFLVIEQREYFGRISCLIYQYQEGGEVKIYDGTFQNIKTNQLLVIRDILGFDLNATSILKMIYEDMENQLNDKPDLKDEIDLLLLKLGEMIHQEFIDYEVDLTQKEMTISLLFKLIKIRVDTQSTSIFKKMLEILHVFKHLSHKKLLVFNNICSFFTNEEIIEMVNYIQLLDMNVLFIEPNKNYVENQFVLDEDFYLYKEDML